MDQQEEAHGGRVPRRVWTAAALMASGRVWGSACTLTYLYVLAIQLTPSGFGRFTFYLAVFMVLDSFVDLGTGQVTIQWTAAAPERTRSVLSAARRLRLIVGTAGAALVGVAVFGLGEEGAGWILLATLYPMSHALELTATVFKNRISWGRPVAVRATAAGLSLLFVLILQDAGVRSPAPYLVAVAGGSTIGNFLLHAVGRGYLPEGEAPPTRVSSLFKAALPMGAASLCQQLYFWVDNLFVRPIAGEQTLGKYNLAVRLMSFAIMAAVYTSAVALPWLTREHAAGRLGKATAKLAGPMLLLGGLGTGLAWPLGGVILSLFGEPGEFAAAEPSLRWLLCAAMAVYAGAPLVTAVVARGETRSVLAGAALGLAVNLVGNALLVPRWGIEGAAAATFATELAVAGYAARALVRGGASPFKASLLWSWCSWPLATLIGLGLGQVLLHLI